MKTAPLTQSHLAVTVGLSGGVDSSVAALLLQQQGYAVQAVFMKNWEEDDTEEYCSAAQDLKDAEAVARRLDLPLHGVNFADQYWDRVFAYFLAEYRAGRTPNPDILCNSEIKFRAFLDYALEHGADKIATGHYARIDEQDGRFRLLKGKDPGKDQSYFLHRLNQDQLAHSLFPVGELHKQQVRQLAEQHQLATHAKKDSTGICFIGERRFKDFLQRYLPARRGEIHDLEGRVLGQHDGLMYYTRGQRQGLHLGGVAGGSGEPWYVADKDLDNNILYVVQGHDHPRLYSQWLIAEDAHWIAGVAPVVPMSVAAKTRYRQEDAPCRVSEAENGALHVEFDSPQWAVTPGQAVVFYRQDECLGGATIVAADNLEYGQRP